MINYSILKDFFQVNDYMKDLEDFQYKYGLHEKFFYCKNPGVVSTISLVDEIKTLSKNEFKIYPHFLNISVNFSIKMREKEYMNKVNYSLKRKSDEVLLYEHNIMSNLLEKSYFLNNESKLLSQDKAFEALIQLCYDKDVHKIYLNFIQYRKFIDYLTALNFHYYLAEREIQIINSAILKENIIYILLKNEVPGFISVKKPLTTELHFAEYNVVQHAMNCKKSFIISDIEKINLICIQ